MGDKPVFRVGAAGLDPRDWRLIEIVFRHSQYNRYEFRLAPQVDAESIDVLIANPGDTEGLQAMTRIRQSSRMVPVIAAVPRGTASSARHAISIDRLTLQLLPILNRVVELELLEAGARAPAGAGAPVPRPEAAARAGGAAIGSASLDAARAPLGELPSSAMERRSAGPDPAAPTARGGAAAPVQRPAEAFGGAEASAPTVPLRAGAQPIAPASVAPAVPLAPAAADGRGPGPAQVGTPIPGTVPMVAETAPAASAAAPAVAMPARASAVPADGPRVLVVDDSPTVRRQLAVAFERLGLRCEQAASAAEALQWLEDGHFDLVLADVVMPDMDGYRLTREIKRNRRLRGLPVIILTSRTSPFDLARGALAGCDSYLTKPVPFRALEAAVRKQLRRSLAIDALSGQRGAGGEPRPAQRPLLPPLARVARLFGR